MARFWPLWRRPSIPFEALIVPVGSAVVLRPASPLTAEQLKEIRERLSLESVRTGVNFMVLPDAEWQAVAIGVPE
ncbi:hypothetical protein CSE6_017_30680 [Comamonas sp. E6]|nr:hypothetical protein CSE6_017_30680 [Comamonas sp. E6]